MSRRVLVTGGASGFGAEVARQLRARGDAVVLCDVDEAGGKAVADELGATFLPCDVSDPDGVTATTDEAESLLDEFRDTVDASLERAAKDEIREIDLLQEILHDDLAAFVYNKIKRRPMVLPVVVEV